MAEVGELILMVHHLGTLVHQEDQAEAVVLLGLVSVMQLPLPVVMVYRDRATQGILAELALVT